MTTSFVPGAYLETAPTRIPGPQGTAHALPVGRSTSSPAIRAKARRLVLLADALVGQCRVLAEQNRRLNDELGAALRNERKLATELESLRRGRTLADLNDPRPRREYAEAAADHRAAVERLDLIRADVTANREQYDVMAKLRTNASKSTAAILGALGDGGRIRSETMESSR